MNSRVNSVIKMHFKDKWSWFIIPWMVLLSSFVINLIVASLVDTPEGIKTGGLASIFVYMLCGGIIVLPQTFPFALGFSVSRRDYMLGTAGMLGLVALYCSAILIIMSLIEQYVIVGWNVNLNFFHFSFMDPMNMFNLFLVYFFAIVHLFVTGFVIGCIYRRFGKNGMFIFFAVLLMIVTFFGYMAVYQGWLGDFYTWVTKYSIVEIINGASIVMLALSVLYALFSYLLLRRSTV